MVESQFVILRHLLHVGEVFVGQSVSQRASEAYWHRSDKKKRSLRRSRYPTSGIDTQSIVLILVYILIILKYYNNNNVYRTNNFSINTVIHKVASLFIKKTQKNNSSLILNGAQDNDGVLKCPWWCPCSMPCDRMSLVCGINAHFFCVCFVKAFDNVGHYNEHESMSPSSMYSSGIGGMSAHKIYKYILPCCWLKKKKIN